MGLPTSELEKYEKELNKERMKIFRRLKKRYSDLLKKFSDVKGLAGGNLLHFLSLIPEVKSFRSTRSFLIYLGLRAVPQKKEWNREARDVLIKIAIKVARHNGVKFNPKKPNWKYLRKLALMIFQRLQEESGAERGSD